MSSGAEPLVERDNDKNPVVALREIAETQLVPDEVKEDLIISLQKQIESDEPEDTFLSGPRPSMPRAEGDAPEIDLPTDDMSKMNEDDILAALQAMEKPAQENDEGDDDGNDIFG